MKAPRWLALGVVVAALAAVGAFALLSSRPAATSTYFEQPSSTGLSGTGKPGERFYVGLAQVESAPGDTIRLLGVDGLPTGATALVVRLKDTDAALGVVQESLIEHPEIFHPLGANPLTSADGPVQIVAVIAATDVDVQVSAPVLRFTVNDHQPEGERLLVSALICAAARHPEGPCQPPLPPEG